MDTLCMGDVSNHEHQSQTNKLELHMSILYIIRNILQMLFQSHKFYPGNRSEGIVSKFCKPWWAHGPMRRAREAPAQVLGW